METAVSVQEQGHIVQYTGFDQEFGLKASTNLTLKTREGDRVTFSLDDSFELSQSEKSAEFSDNTEASELSLSAKAASDFSLKVEGDLNEEELSAIRDLTQTLKPIAQSFFTENGFDTARAEEVLSGSLGVITELEVSLEKTVRAEFRAESYQRIPAEHAQVLEQNPGKYEPPTGQIRDLNGLVQSVIDSAFGPYAEEFPEDSLIQTFAEFKNFLTQQIVKILNPELPPEPETGAVAEKAESEAVPAEEAETAPESGSGTRGFEPVTV